MTTATKINKEQVLKKRQRVVCAAIQLPDGHIITGARHYDEIMVAQLLRANITIDPAAAQGFIDQFGNFLTRQEAFEIARVKDQFYAGAPHTVGFLYSEDLY